jgi:tRNA(adenine34) deaminase
MKVRYEQMKSLIDTIMTTILRLRRLFPLMILMIISNVYCWNIRWARSRTRRTRQHYHFPLGTDEIIVHEHFFDLAINEANQAAKRGEVPIGAVVVRNITSEHDDALNQQKKSSSLSFEILAAEGNRVEQHCDASAHAELLALRRAAKNIHNWRLSNCTLYSTLECCPMCLTACQAFRIERLVYGAPDLRLGAVETHMRLLHDFVHPFHNLSVVISRVKEEQCSFIMKDFFRQRRKQTSSQNSIMSRRRQWPSWITFWR